MFAVATDTDSDQVETVGEKSTHSSDEERLNLDFVASTDMDQDFNEDLEVDIEDPEELLHLEEFEAEIEAMLSDGENKKT